MFCGKNKHQGWKKCSVKGATFAACDIKDHFARCYIKSEKATYVNANRRAVRAIGSKDDDDVEQTARLNMILNDEIEETENDREDDYYGTALNIDYAIRRVGQQAIVNVTITDKCIKMIYDPGAMFTVSSESIGKKVGSPQLRPVSKLEVYTHITTKTLGIAGITVQTFEQKLRLQVTVIKKDISLFGIDWCTFFKLPFSPGV